MPRITRLLDEVDYGPGGGLSGGTGWGAGPVRYTLAARLMERNPALVPLLGPGGDLFAGTTVPASPMSVLKGRFSHYEKMLPLLYAHLSPMGL